MKPERARLLRTIRERDLAEALDRLHRAGEEARDLRARVEDLSARIASLREAAGGERSAGAALNAAILESASLARDLAKERIARYEKDRREISVELEGAVARRDAAAEEAGNARRALANLDGVLRDLPE